MPLEEKAKIYEGLKIAVGDKAAAFCWSSFHHKYMDKHGSCLEYIHSHSSEFDAFQNYTRRENNVWRRYAMMYAHTIAGLRFMSGQDRKKPVEMKYELETAEALPSPSYDRVDMTQPASPINPHRFP